nr:RNA-directed DNA polymerase, eukaryota, reverse transcriptase zinc-binding domain protein [Tanacetum cinerariifolium]
MNIMNKLTTLEKIESFKLTQKAKVKWSIEGDENSKYLHGIINKQRNNIAIRGILVDGTWIEDPKDAKLVKDFRPIILIGSLYKIIAKILANHLVIVMGDLVNEVQSAFIANRQILDGPFILNELIQSCKVQKKQTMIFKVDFEKALDSIRWDFLDDVWKNFGFGVRWRDWIQRSGEFFVSSVRNLIDDQILEEIAFKSQYIKDNVLVSKEKGGLGVLSFYALNEALNFKSTPVITTPTPETTTSITNAQLQAMIDQGITAALAACDATRNGDDSHTSGTGRPVQVAHECTYPDFLKCQPLNFKGTKRVVGLSRWFEKMESVFSISNYTIACQVKFATCTLQENSLTWWNSHVKTTTPEAAHAMPWRTLKKMMTDKYCPRGEIKKLESEM